MTRTEPTEDGWWKIALKSISTVDNFLAFMENGSSAWKPPIEWTTVKNCPEYSTAIRQYCQINYALRLNMLARDTDWKGLTTKLKSGKLIVDNNVILTYYGMDTNSQNKNKWTLCAAKIKSLSLL